MLEMDTLTKDGSLHTTKSVRICSPHEQIVYKQIMLPALMTLHTGYWQLAEDGDGTTATSQHTVIINTANIAAVLGDRGRRRRGAGSSSATRSAPTAGPPSATPRNYAESRS